jgi:arylsulfatase A-like enzyme
MRIAGVLVCAAALAACAGPKQGVDLLASPDSLVEARVGKQDRTWVRGQFGKQVRIDDAVLRTLPAGPESRLVFRADIPRQGRLRFSHAVHPDGYDRPGIEFTVKVLEGKREEVAWTRLLDPLGKPAEQGWQRADVDLSRYAGRERTLIFETRGFEPAISSRQALWGSPSITAPEETAPLAILYIVDTLRADHTTPYGYSRDTTPELARFARDAVVFDAAIAQASWTRPSVGSIMTSLLPGRHLAVQLRDPLDPGLVTLAEMLQAKGISTAATIANSVIYSAGTHFEQGFDDYRGMHDASGRASKEVPAAPVVDEALAQLRDREGLPTFLYVHTMDPHVPYTPPAPFDRKYEPHPAPGHPAIDPRTDFKEPLDRERLVAQYDGEVAYGDQEFGRFVRELKARGLYDRALIVVMADHGEEFQDHGKWLHGRSLFDELIRIPLIVKFPAARGAGRRVAEQVQTLDVLPTVLREMGLPVPPTPVILGHPLQDVVRGGAPEPPAISEISHRGFVAYGMRTRQDKYVHRFSPERDELYFDLAADPREQASRLATGGERVRSMRAGVEAAMVIDPFRRHLQLVGSSEYVLSLTTSGWIQGVEPIGFGGGDTHTLEDGGRRLEVRVRARPGQHKEVAFTLRPLGAPVHLAGTRDGRKLQPSDLLIAEAGFSPSAVPLRLPEVESEAEAERNENMLAPPRWPRDGVLFWLTPAPGRGVMDFDPETRERLKALGYLGPG